MPAERWVDEWDERFAEPKVVSKRTAERVWAKAERRALRLEAAPAAAQAKYGELSDGWGQQECLADDYNFSSPADSSNFAPAAADETSLRVSGRAETFFANVVGFLRSKWALDAAAAAELPEGLKGTWKSFAEADVVQNGDTEEAVYAAAAEAAPVFEEKLRRVARDLPPTAIDFAPLKGRDRARENKTNLRYGG